MRSRPPAPSSSPLTIPRCCVRSSSMRARAAFPSCSRAGERRRVPARDRVSRRRLVSRTRHGGGDLVAHSLRALARGGTDVRATRIASNASSTSRCCYDSLTGLPTLPVMIERTRGLFKDRGELVVSTSTSCATRRSRRSTAGRSSTRCSRRPRPPCASSSIDDALGTIARDGQLHERRRLHLLPRPGDRRRGRDGERDHGDRSRELQRTSAAVSRRSTARTSRRCSTSTSGASHVYYNPKIRLERLIYRGIREAANAARSVEERERARRVADPQASAPRAARSTSTIIRSSSPRRARSSATRRSRAA